MSEQHFLDQVLADGQPHAFAELTDLGLSRASLYRALQTRLASGEIQRTRHGVYQRVSGDGLDPWVRAQMAAPRGVICLLSALAFHVIGTQQPGAIWMALPQSARRPSTDWPPLKLFHFSKATYSVGVETHAREGGVVHVYSAAKTVADCFKFRNRIGMDVAIEALREGWSDRRFTLTELREMARVCRVERVIRPYVEALVS